MYVGVALRGRFGGSVAVWSSFRFRGLPDLFSIILIVPGKAYLRLVLFFLAPGSVGKDSVLSGELGTLSPIGLSIAAEVFVGLRID